MTSEPPRSPPGAGERGDDAPSGGMSAQDRKIAHGRTLYDNVGTFRDVFKIVLIVAVLIAIAIVFLL